jgi:hypothetical protein
VLTDSASWFGDFFFPAEARGQVKEAAERLGGEYSGSLHPKCTHLVVQISLTPHNYPVPSKSIHCHICSSKFRILPRFLP